MIHVFKLLFVFSLIQKPIFYFFLQTAFIASMSSHFYAPVTGDYLYQHVLFTLHTQNSQLEHIPSIKNIDLVFN